MTALNFSADEAAREETAPGAEPAADAKPAVPSGGVPALLQGLVVAVSLAIGVLLFVVLPARLTPLIQHAAGLPGRYAFGSSTGRCGC